MKKGYSKLHQHFSEIKTLVSMGAGIQKMANKFGCNYYTMRNYIQNHIKKGG